MGSVPSRPSAVTLRRSSSKRVFATHWKDLGHGYVTDGITVFYENKPIVPPPCVVTFQVLENNPGWARDKTNIYRNGAHVCVNDAEIIV